MLSGNLVSPMQCLQQRQVGEELFLYGLHLRTAAAVKGYGSQVTHNCLMVGLQEIKISRLKGALQVVDDACKGPSWYSHCFAMNLHSNWMLSANQYLLNKHYCVNTAWADVAEREGVGSPIFKT